MKKIRIALIGAGNIANTHLDAYRTLPNVEIAAICDIDEARLTTTADKYGIAVMQILDAIYESAATGHKVTIN